MVLTTSSRSGNRRRLVFVSILGGLTVGLGATAVFACIGVVVLLALILGRIADQLIVTAPLKDGEAGTGIIDRLLVIGGRGLRLFRLRVVVPVRVVEIAAAVAEPAHVISKVIAVAVVAEGIVTHAIVAEVACSLISGDGDKKTMAVGRNAGTTHSDSTAASIGIDGARDAYLGLQQST